MVVVPTDNPNLPSVKFEDTSTYYWPQFDLNITDAFGNTPVEGFTTVNGPSMFKKAVALSSDKKEVKKCDDLSKTPFFHRFLLRSAYRTMTLPTKIAFQTPRSAKRASPSPSFTIPSIRKQNWIFYLTKILITMTRSTLLAPVRKLEDPALLSTDKGVT